MIPSGNLIHRMLAMRLVDCYGRLRIWYSEEIFSDQPQMTRGTGHGLYRFDLFGP